jgi:hypothetical protein
VRERAVAFDVMGTLFDLPPLGDGLNGLEPRAVVSRGGVASALDSGSIPCGRDVGPASVTENGKPVDEPFWFADAAFRAHARIIR